MNSSKIFSYKNSFLIWLINIFGSNKKRVKGKKNKIFTNNSLIQNCTFKIAGDNNKIILKEECVFKNTLFFISGNNNIIEISSKCKYNGGSLWIEDDSNLITIGQSSTFVQAHLQITESNKSIIIGDDCMFAYDIELKTGDSHSIIDLEKNKRINFAKNIKLG